MQLHASLLVACLAVACVTPTSMTQEIKPDPNQQARSFTKHITRTVRLDYLLFMPPESPSHPEKIWPLLLFLHGAGERGSDLWLVSKHGPPKILRTKPDLPFIVVSPQCPTAETWSNDALIALLDDLSEQLPVDRTRVYLTGLSMGGYGTWSLGTTYPDRFAAIAPICGGGDPVRILLASGNRAEALRTLHVWAFHGAKDPVVSVEESRRMVDALKRFGSRQVELTIYPEAGHDAWTETYSNPKLYDWLLSHKRDGGSSSATRTQ